MGENSTCYGGPNGAHRSDLACECDDIGDNHSFMNTQMQTLNANGVPRSSTTSDAAVESRFPVGSWKRIIYGLSLTIPLRLTVYLGIFVFGPLLGVGEQVFDGSIAALMATLAMLVYAVGGVAGLGVIYFGRETLQSLGWKSAAPQRDVALGILGLFALVGVMLAAFVCFGESLTELWQTVLAFPAGLRAQFLVIGVLAALAEETLFRGYLQPAAQAKLGTFWGIVLVALVFSLYHMTPHPLGLVVKFGFGLVLGFLRFRTQSLVAPAVAHFAVWQVLGFA